MASPRRRISSPFKNRCGISFGGPVYPIRNEMKNISRLETIGQSSPALQFLEKTSKHGSLSISANTAMENFSHADLSMAGPSGSNISETGSTSDGNFLDFYNDFDQSIDTDQKRESDLHSSLPVESDEYRAKRERNNAAVRKCREKKKLKEREIQENFGKIRKQYEMACDRIKELEQEVDWERRRNQILTNMIKLHQGTEAKEENDD